MDDALKAKVLEAFRQKSTADKKMFYIRDVVKWLPEVDRHAVQEAVKQLIDEDALKYWSSGSTTYIVLAEHYPKQV